MRWKFTKTTKIVIATIIIYIAVDVIVLSRVSSQSSSDLDVPAITKIEIAQYDGTDKEKPIYLALDGYVYDVSPGREDYYNPGEVYHYLVGKDSSELLHVMGGAIIKQKYKIVGKYAP